EKANTHYKDEFNRHTIDLIKGLVDKMPILDETCGGVLSWLNFTLKYQWCQLRMYTMFDIPYEKYEHFFDTTEFQQWSMSNPMSVKFPDYDPTKYKLPTKDYIRSYTNDGIYYDRKEKVPSMQTTQKVFGKEGAMWSSIDENMNKAYIDRPVRNFTINESGEGVVATMNNIEIDN
nr:hypothetical protein [Gammaproteobacteria bacterium]